MIKKIRSCVLYLALLSGMLFSAVTLGSNTAYAACDCEAAFQDVVMACSMFGGLRYFSCHSPSGQVHFSCVGPPFTIWVLGQCGPE